MVDIKFPLGFSLFFLVAFHALVPLSIFFFLSSVVILHKLFQFMMKKYFHRILDQKFALITAFILVSLVVLLFKDLWTDIFFQGGPYFLGVALPLLIGILAGKAIQAFYLLETGKKLSKVSLYIIISAVSIVFFVGLIVIFFYTLTIY